MIRGLDDCACRTGQTEDVMSDKDLLGLLIGVGLLIAFAAYMAYIYFHPDRFGWLALSSTDTKSPSAGNAVDYRRRGHPQKFRNR